MGRKMWLRILRACAIWLSPLIAVQQTLTYGWVPMWTTVQVGRSEPVENLDVSGLEMGKEVRFQAPYSFTNQSSDSRLVMVKVTDQLPPNCSLSVKMEDRPGLICTPPVIADGIDRHLVVSMARGSYDGHVYFRMNSKSRETLKGTIPILYTVLG